MSADPLTRRLGAWLDRPMTRYADPERCPDCGAAMPAGSRACPGCTLPLDGPLAARLFALLAEADQVLAQLRRPTAPALAPAPPGAQGGPFFAGATPATVRRRGLSTASVPQILLGLGAVCLLVAAVVFLAVTWSRLGVAGRTGVLVALTASGAAVTAWLARQDLRAATESLAVVTLGLLTLDVLGAADAGWLGRITDEALLVLVGSVLAGASTGAALAVTRTRTAALRSGEAMAALGLATVMAGVVLTGWFSDSASLLFITVLAGAATAGARLLRLPVLTTGAGLLSVAAWLVLAPFSWDRAVSHPSFSELWLEGEIWPLLASAVVLGAAAAVPLVTDGLRRVALAVAELVVAAALLAPAADEPFRIVVLAVVLVVVVATAAAWFAPAGAVRAWLATPVVAGLGLLAVSLHLGSTAVERLTEAGSAVWAGSLTDTLPRPVGDERDAWLLPVTVASVGLVVALLHRRERGVRAAGTGLLARLSVPERPAAVSAAGSLVAVLCLLGALTAGPVAVWVLVAVPLLAGAAMTAVGLARPGRAWLVAALVPALPALVVGLRAPGLTLAATATVGAAASVVLVRRPLSGEAGWAAALLAPTLAGTVWSFGELADAPGRWTALAGILVVGVLALVPLPNRSANTALGASALVSAFGLTAAGVVAAALARMSGASDTGTATWAAGYLTATGALMVVAALLDPDRGRAGWLGGGLLALASWLRLADVGVETPEAYTVPSALALVTVGLLHLRRHPEAGTTRALSAGLGLGLVPSLLWVLDDPLGLRAVLLGLTCLALVVLGARQRWSAPLLFGAAVGLLVALRQVAPMVDAVPRWALIGTAGTVLVVLGVTWERRLQEARSVAGYVRALR